MGEETAHLIDKYDEQINKNKAELIQLQKSLDETIESKPIEDAEYKSPEVIDAAPEYQKLNTIMINEIAQKMGTPNIENETLDYVQIDNIETTETYIAPSMIMTDKNELTALSEAEIAQTDISKLDETAVTPVRVETVVKLTSESSLEQIPQIVLGKCKTLNLLPFASNEDEEADEEERKVESEKQKREKDEILAMQKQYHSLHGQHVNSKQHMVILSGDDSELSPLPPERTENEKENEGHLQH